MEAAGQESVLVLGEDRSLGDVVRPADARRRARAPRRVGGRFGAELPADGVHLRLRLTHEVISHLVAARRPSVSAALTRLAKRGVLRRDGAEWLLSGPPPEAV
jgi:CRP-like cAMP-binding protein